MEVRESLSLVAKLILDSMGEIKESSLNTQMGIELFNLAKKELSKEPSQPKSVIDPEIDRKIRELKSVEGEGGIAWIDYYSWCLLPTFFQNEVIQLLDPLVIWQGVFILRFKLEKLEYQIWSKLPYHLAVYELRDLSSIHICVLSTDRSVDDGLNHLQFKKKRLLFESQCVRSIGNSDHGLMIRMREKTQ